MPHQQADQVCPPWVGLVSLLNPLRRIHHTPQSILRPHLTEGMTVIEPADFFLAFALVHEVPEPLRFFEQATIH